MNSLRRNLLKGAAGASTVVVAVAAGLLKPVQVMAAVPRSLFEAKNASDVLKAIGASTAETTAEIRIKSPDIAENGSVVPVEVTSNLAGTTAITILAENNPTPLAADFNLIEGVQGVIATRIKMAKTGLIRAVVKANGKFYTATKEVKVTIGGCGG